MREKVSMRTLFIDPDTVGLPEKNFVLEVSPLLRGIRCKASKTPLNYDIRSRDGQAVELLLKSLVNSDTFYSAISFARGC